MEKLNPEDVRDARPPGQGYVILVNAVNELIDRVNALSVGNEVKPVDDGINEEEPKSPSSQVGRGPRRR